MDKLRAGFVYTVEKWKKLTKEEKDKIKHKCLKLVILGCSIKYYNQRKIGEEITMVFSSKIMLQFCDNAEWGIEYTPDFMYRVFTDKTAVPEEFILIPNISLADLIELRYQILCKDLEIHCFYNGNTLYRGKVLDNGQLLMVKC